MSTTDTCCTIVPYLTVNPGHLAEFKALSERFVAKTEEEPGCLYYGFCFDRDTAFCRDGYVDADALLAHVENVGPLLQEAFKIAEIARLEIHGLEAELAKLRRPLKELNATFFTLEYGFRR